jgi:hypothetical protein
MNQVSKRMTMSRRGLLLSGVTILGSVVALSSLPSWALPEPDDALHLQYMRLSRLLINHRLNPEIGARMVKVAAAEHADLAKMMNDIIGIASSKQAARVEDFFGDIPAGPLQNLAYWIISAWYSGSSSSKHDAQVFTFEEALTFQTTLDVVTIPSYGLSGPNRWSQVTVALSNMPRF